MLVPRYIHFGFSALVPHDCFSTIRTLFLNIFEFATPCISVDIVKNCKEVPLVLLYLGFHTQQSQLLFTSLLSSNPQSTVLFSWRSRLQNIIVSIQCIGFLTGRNLQNNPVILDIYRWSNLVSSTQLACFWSVKSSIGSNLQFTLKRLKD